MELVYLFLVSLVSLSFLSFSAPFPFSLCSYGSSMEAVVMAGFFSVLVHVAVKVWIVMILLERCDVLV